MLGESLTRIDARDKVLGKAKYAGDISFPDQIYLKVKRSSYPHALIKGIKTKEASSLEGVVDVLIGKDLPTLHKYGLIIQDQPVLCTEKVRYLGDPLAIVVAETEEIAKRALQLIQVEYSPLPVISSPFQALKEDAPFIHEGGNLLHHAKLARGDVNKGFLESTHIFSHSFSTAPLDQIPLQVEAGVAKVDGDGVITIWAACQWLHDLKAQIARTLGIPQDKVRLIQPIVGGAFGKREDISVHIHLALMALRTKRPVKLVYSREESMITQAKRHPIHYQLRTGLDREGRIVAWEGTLYGDTGAYASGGPAVIRQALFLAPGPYYIPHLKGDAYLYYTNNTYCGAMRGFGGTQSAFAYESHMDMMAQKIGVDPVQFRKINALYPGTITPTGQKIYSLGMLETIEGAMVASSWAKVKKEKENRGRKKKGIGIATTFFGIGYGEGFPDHAHAKVVLKEGGVEIWTAGADVGQGLHTILVQLVGQVLAIEPEKITIKGQDTSTTFSAGSTSASRQTYFSGNAVVMAASDLKMRLYHKAASLLGGSVASFSLKGGRIISRENPDHNISLKELYRSQPAREMTGEAFFFKKTSIPDPKSGQGTHVYASYAFATQVAVVEVDTLTGEVQVLKVYGAHDVGKAINPCSIEGQVEGGVAMGVGMALMEEQIYQEGVTLNPNLTDYVIPTIFDVPKVETIIIEEEEPTGPFGARGIGEPATIPTAPAIINAIYDAIGVRCTELPVTPEKILFQLKRED